MKLPLWVLVIDKSAPTIVVGSEALLFAGFPSAVTPGVTCTVFVTVPRADELTATTSEIIGAEVSATITEA